MLWPEWLSTLRLFSRGQGSAVEGASREAHRPGHCDPSESVNAPTMMFQAGPADVDITIQHSTSPREAGTILQESDSKGADNPIRNRELLTLADTELNSEMTLNGSLDPPAAASPRETDTLYQAADLKGAVNPIENREFQTLADSELSSEMTLDGSLDQPIAATSPRETDTMFQAGDSKGADNPIQDREFQTLAEPEPNSEVTLSESLDQPAATDTSPRTAATLEGVVVPGYDILGELGRGGMGVVYKARHQKLQRLVALKMILAGAHAGAAGLARFRAEAEAVAQLQHANIIQGYETGEHEGRPYFSLEFVTGGSLEQRIRESPTTPRAAAQLIETLARTMDVAHQHGIVHRDLKPANILQAASSGKSSLFRKEQISSMSLPADHWSRTMVPKIADFGLAKRVDNDSGQTGTGTIIGTPSYMSPEQAEGRNHEIGPAADIYALGAILYDLLTGRPPFKAGNPIDTIRQVIDQEPVAPRQLEPRVPRDLETICLKCLEKEPAKRYTHAVELAEELRRFLDDEPILARPTPAWERAWKWGKRRPAIVALLGVTATAVLSMVLFIVWHNVSLRDRLDEALADERTARHREEDAVEKQRLSQVQNEAQKLFDSARVAAAASDWPNAQLDLTKALTVIRSESLLDGLKKPAEALPL